MTTLCLVATPNPDEPLPPLPTAELVVLEAELAVLEAEHAYGHAPSVLRRARVRRAEQRLRRACSQRAQTPHVSVSSRYAEGAA